MPYIQKQHTYAVFGQKRRTVTFYQNYRSYVVRVKGLEPSRLLAPEPKSGASANSAIPARPLCIITNYFLIVKQNILVAHSLRLNQLFSCLIFPAYIRYSTGRIKAAIIAAIFIGLRLTHMLYSWLKAL